MHRGVKTFSSERLVPIHEHLIELGFLRHVVDMRQRGATALCPELIATNDSQSFGDKIYYNWAKALVLQLDGKTALPNGRSQPAGCDHHLLEYETPRPRDESPKTRRARLLARASGAHLTPRMGAYLAHR